MIMIEIQYSGAALLLLVNPHILYGTSYINHHLKRRHFVVCSTHLTIIGSHSQYSSYIIILYTWNIMQAIFVYNNLSPKHLHCTKRHNQETTSAYNSM